MTEPTTRRGRPLRAPARGRGRARLTGIAAVLALVVAAGPARAQTLGITIRSPLPNQLEVGDPWSLDVSNATGVAQRVTFHARVTEARAGLVFDAVSAAIDLPPGSRALDARRLQPIRVVQAAASIASQLGRLASFPDGAYTICVEALPEGGGAPLGQGCLDQSVTAVVPPILIGPYKDTAITDPFVVWSWFMQPQARGGTPVVCDLTVAEILPHQTAEEALRRNPPVLVRKDLRASVWQTNEAARAFRSGATYAWKLVARIGDAVVSESEIWTFTYAAPTADAVASADTGGTRSAVAAAETPATSEDSDGAIRLGAPRPAAPGPDPGAALPKPVEVRTRSRAITEASNRPGLLSGAPRSYARLEIEPTLLVYGSPLELDLLVSSERDGGRNELSRGALAFKSPSPGTGFVLRQHVAETAAPPPTAVPDARSSNELRADSLRSAGNTPTSLARTLEQNAALPALAPTTTAQELAASADGSALRTLRQVPAFSFGNVAPAYTRLTLAGVTMTGGSVEYDPGRFFASLAAGKVQRDDVPPAVAALPLDGGGALQLFRDLYAGRVGVGSRNGTHLIATGMYARDDGQSRAILSLADSAAGVAAQENWVVGLAGRSVGGGGRWVLDAETDASLFHRDRSGARFEGLPNGGATALFPGSKEREGATTDWAGALRGSMTTRDGLARVVSGVRFVGPGYASVGTRGLRHDVLQYDGSVDRLLAKGRVTLGAQAGWERSGVVLPGRGRVTLLRLSTRAELRPARGPGVQLAWTRNDQDLLTAGGATRLAQTVDQVAVRLRQSAVLGPLRSSSFLAFDGLHGRSGDPTGRNRSWNVQLAELVSTRSGLSMFLRASHSTTVSALEGDADPRIDAVETSLIRPFGRFLEASLGGNLLDGDHTSGHGLFLGARAQLGAAGSFDVRWDSSDVTDPATPGGRRRDHVARAALTLGSRPAGL